MNYELNTVSHLVPVERQKNYIYLFDDFKSSFEVVKYLVNFSRTQAPFTGREKAASGLLEECSLSVRFLFSMDQEKRMHIRVNSDSQVVQGVLAVFADIYQRATENEIREAPSVFQNYLPQGIAPSFERKDGVKRLYYKLLDFSRGW